MEGTESEPFIGDEVNGRVVPKRVSDPVGTVVGIS